MKQEEIISMAKECGVHEYGPLTRNWSFELSQLERFAAIVAAHEREACAKVCEEGIHNAEDWDSSYWDQCCNNRAAAIRARSDK